MLRYVRRKVRVRQQSIAAGEREAGYFEDFAAADAVILLGDPGMGKTSLLRSISDGAAVSVRRFLANPNSALERQTVYIDALDEYRLTTSGSDALLQIVRALISHGKPRFVLACRSADWEGTDDLALIKEASASSTVTVLELLPLADDEISHALEGSVESPKDFLDWSYEFGLRPLISNPLSLEHFAHKWSRSNAPKGKASAYSKAIDVLLSEANEQHQRRPAKTMSIAELRALAGRVCAVLLLSGSTGISHVRQPTELGYVALEDFADADIAAIEQLVKRRLFSSSDDGVFEVSHRTFAEFLAAEYLAKCTSHGMSIGRVLGLLCGTNRNPPPSNRGLLGWFLCQIGDDAARELRRDPYAVLAYGDAHLLGPRGQKALWQSLEEQLDPWFLSFDQERPFVWGLANGATAPKLHEILSSAVASTHLKVLVLDALWSSPPLQEFTEITRQIALMPIDNAWMRRRAVKAFYRSTGGDMDALLKLDEELRGASKDPWAFEVRVAVVDVLRRQRTNSQLIMSIIDQALAVKRETHVIGHLYPLIELAADEELDDLLEWACVFAGAPRDRDQRAWPSHSRSLEEAFDKHDSKHEITRLIYTWLARRLNLEQPIGVQNAGRWLIWLRRDLLAPLEPDVANALRGAIKNERISVDELLEAMVAAMPDEAPHFGTAMRLQVQQILPDDLWPAGRFQHYVQCALKVHDASAAATLFLSAVGCLPSEPTLYQVDMLFNVLQECADVQQMVDGWQTSILPDWHWHDFRRKKALQRKRAAIAAKNAVLLRPHLPEIETGKDLPNLQCAAFVYSGMNSDFTHVKHPTERLIAAADDECASALLRGLIAVVESAKLPDADEIISAWLAGEWRAIDFLIGISIYLRLKQNLAIPSRAVAAGVTVAAIVYSPSGELPDYDPLLECWLLECLDRDAGESRQIVETIWRRAVEHQRVDLPTFHLLSKNEMAASWFVEACRRLLVETAGIDVRLARIVLAEVTRRDRTATEAIIDALLGQEEYLTDEYRALLYAAAFCIDLKEHQVEWQKLPGAPRATISQAVKFMMSFSENGVFQRNFSLKQSAAVISLFGPLYKAKPRPKSGWGEDEDFNGRNFVAQHIESIAQSSEAEADALLKALQREASLEEYHDVIRHHRGRRATRGIGYQFEFLSPAPIWTALQNGPPANAADLLNYVLGHLTAIDKRLTATGFDSYLAYWNLDGRKRLKPKSEEICSGLLAHELQQQIKPHGLRVEVEAHYASDKRCDIQVSMSTDHVLPIEVKHQNRPELWTAWRTQLDALYASHVHANRMGIYLVLWSGLKRLKVTKPPQGLPTPQSASELQTLLESLIPEGDRSRLRVFVLSLVPDSEQISPDSRKSDS